MSTRPNALLIAGFGDNASMYAPLSTTRLAEQVNLVPLNLPGFGCPPLSETTTLDGLADFVAEASKTAGATIIVAHSVASIIASLAATKPSCPLSTILSLEGNITPEDAYFSGTAASYPDPESFRMAFLQRLDEMGPNEILNRYRQQVETADPRALWKLGQDAARFSAEHIPGDVLSAAADVTYFYNPENCPDSTVAWLEAHPLKRTLLPDASHWPSLDVPELLAEEMIKALQ
jgi:pimeloyl-ACP methyl ester carboxylesterase